MSDFFFTFKGKNHVLKSPSKFKPQSPNENGDAFGELVVAPDYSATVLAAKLSSISHEHIYSIFYEKSVLITLAQVISIIWQK